MPYKYKKVGDKYVVYKKDTGKRVGSTAGTKAALKKYLAALHINANENVNMKTKHNANEAVTKLRNYIREYIKEELAKKDYDGDGKVESPEAEYKGSRDKAIKKAMKKDTTEATLKSIEEIAQRFTKLSNRLNEEETQLLPSQADAENIQIMAGDVQKLRTLLAALYKDALDAQKENKTPSPYMDAYVKLILAMLPITGALMSTGVLAGALKQGKLALGANSQYNLGSSLTAPKKTPPPIPPLPPKAPIPPIKKLPPTPPIIKKGSVPPPPPPRK